MSYWDKDHPLVGIDDMEDMFCWHIDEDQK